ncbi:ABC transporter ATP-binding protein [Herbiconiux sp. P17]|uniref:ABC transporter ATP-binding protein n=1 Tax=Herbiconiux wuyangfengii TaxID=3342794 RepID=UPI0035B99A94
MVDTISSGTPVLDVSDVSVHFSGLAALSHVSFRVEPATVHAVIGPNGAGKSSCFNALTGVYRASTGTVTLGDHVLTGLRPHEITRFGVARTFQNIALSRSQDVCENLMLARHQLTKAGFLSNGLRLPRAVREERLHRRRVVEIAEFVGIAQYLNTECGALPYGIQKKIELARALCLEPRVLLLDEPVAGLNSEETRDMAQMILDVRDELGTSVLLVEHDMGMVMGIADRVTVLDFGKCIADGTTEQIQNDPAVVRAYLGTGKESSEASNPAEDPSSPEAQP